MATSASTLTCPQCGYVNEAERVYCHNCGAKLDRSLLPKEDDKETRDSIERTRKRVRKMTNPGRGLQDVKTLLGTLFWAALVAAVILIAREPDGIPPRQDNVLADRMIGSELLDALESPQPRAIQFNERDINQHLAGTRSKTKGYFGIKFERAFAALDPGVIRIGMQQSLWGFPVYSSVGYKLQIKGGRLVATTIDGSFGRLKIHPELMQYASASFRQLWGALTREKEQLDKMQGVRIEKGRIIFWTKGVPR
jgi:hypothetical protein